MNDCIFCKIVKGDSPATVELDTENVIVFKNIAPAAETHLLVVPKEHIPTFMDLNSENASLLAEMVESVQAMIKKKGIENGYKVIFNGGKYQAVKHLHWHLLGGDLEEDAEDKT